MKKMSRALLMLAVAVLIVASSSAAFAEESPTEVPTEPAAAPTEPVAAPTPDPTAVPAPAQAGGPAAAPTEAPGVVDLTIYVYDNGAAADGYTVTIDETRQVAGSDGKVTFPNLTVERHNLNVTDKSGGADSGVLYMSRADSTRITDQAMGGTYGVSIARGASALYMNVHFSSQGAVRLDQVSDKAPSPPPGPGASASAGASAPASAGGTAYDTKNITAQFNGEDGGAIRGMGVTAEVAGIISIRKSTNQNGRISMSGVPYGSARLSFGEEFDPFTLTLQRGERTAAVSSGGEYVVSAAAGAQDVFLVFEQDGGRFILKSVSEETVSGGSNLLLGVAAVAVIVVVVIIVVAAVRRHSVKKRRVSNERYNRNNDRYYGYDDRDDGYERDETRRAGRGGTGGRNGEPGRTGGSNKYSDRSRM